MQTMSQRIEEKQDLLKQVDPEREAKLDEMFVDYVGGVYHDPSMSRPQKLKELEEAEKVYESALDAALKDEGIR